jgi:hypothetical protein
LQKLRTDALERGLGVGHGLLLQRRVDAGQQLSLLHLVVEIDKELGNLSRDLRADLNRRDGVERAGRGNGRLQIAALDGCESIRGGLARKRRAMDEHGHACEHDHQGGGDERFLSHDGLHNAALVIHLSGM